METFHLHKKEIQDTLAQLQGLIDKLNSMAEDYLEQEEALFVISEFAYDWEYWQDSEGNYKYVSPSCETLTGYKPADFYADKNLLKQIIVEDDWPKWRKHSHIVEKNGRITPTEFEICTKGGRRQWIHHVCRRVTNKNGKDLGIRGSNRDITIIKNLQNKLLYASGHDHLTGLPNRALLLEHLEQSIKRAKRLGELFVVAFYDVDCFKKINDLYGHDVGDIVLKKVAKDISKATRKNDIISRFGGDEFVAIYNVKSFDDMQTIKNKILRRINTAIQCEKINITIQLSVGMSMYPDDGLNKELLLKKADEKMYAMKAKNKANRLIPKLSKALDPVKVQQNGN